MRKFILAAALAITVSPLIAMTSAYAQSASPTVYGLQVEEFERRWGDEDEKVNVWNADAFIGDDDIRFRWITAGEYDDRANRFEKLDNRFVGQVPVSTFFDAKAGVRFDTPNGKNKDRAYGMVGVTGLAPQWFELDADLFYSNKRNFSASIDAEYELLITNHLILAPSADVSFAFSDDTEIELKSGISGAEVGLRLSYDLVDRALSPYVGVAYERKLGNTADFREAEGEDIESWFGVVGLKMIF